MKLYGIVWDSVFTLFSDGFNTVANVVQITAAFEHAPHRPLEAMQVQCTTHVLAVLRLTRDELRYTVSDVTGIYLSDEEMAVIPVDRPLEGFVYAVTPFNFIEFEGEGHGFRRAENLVRAVEAELWFYGHVLGFEPADDIVPLSEVLGTAVDDTTLAERREAIDPDPIKAALAVV